MAKPVLLKPQEALDDSWLLLMRRISERTENDLTAVQSHINTVNDLLEKMRQFGKALLSGNVPAIKGAVQNLSGSILEVFERFEATVKKIEAQREAAESAQESINMQLELSERQRQEALAQRERELDSLRERIMILETTVRTGDGPLAKSIQEVSKQAIDTLDGLIMSGNRLQPELQRITRDVHDILPNMEAELEQTITDLSVRAAPHLVQSTGLGREADNLDELHVILKDLDEVQKQYQALNELLAACRNDFTKEEQAFTTWQETWRGIRQTIDAAAVIFPRITNKDLYALAGTTVSIVQGKRQFCGSLLGQIQSSLSETRNALDRQAEVFGKSQQTIEVRFQELVTLRERLHIPWFEALDDEHRAIVQQLLLIYEEPAERISAIQLAAILVAQKVLLGETAEETVLELMGNDFFTPRGGVGFKVFVLTERGKFWWRRWRDEYRDQIASLSVAKEWVRREKIAAAEEEQRSRQQRNLEAEEKRKAAEEARLTKEREREIKKTGQRNPQVILERLNHGEQELLAALSFRAELPAPRDSTAWSKLLAAMQGIGLISSRADFRRLSRTLANLLQFDPRLFVADRGMGNLVLRLSDVGLETVRILPTLDHRYGDNLETIMNREIRVWSPTDLERRKQLLPFCEEILGTLPRELYTKDE